MDSGWQLSLKWLCGNKKRPEKSGLKSDLDNPYWFRGCPPVRSATIFRALSAKDLAWGSNSSALVTCGSVSARTFKPSSCPNTSTKTSLLMLDRTQALFSSNSASV